MSNAVPRVSIVVPTKNRHWALPLVARCALSQTHKPHEVLIHDGSAEAHPILAQRCEPPLRYVHAPAENEAIGHKRNVMCSEATGDVIAFFDDDDFYHSTYLAWMLGSMREHDASVMKLLSFFCYHVGHRLIGHYDLRKRSGVVWDWNRDRITQRSAEEIFTGELGNHLGYSANYVFFREVWRRNPFEPVAWNEDAPWLDRAIRSGELALGIDEIDGRHLHLCHASNLSRCFPHSIETTARLCCRDREIRRFLLSHGAPVAQPAAVALSAADANAPAQSSMMRSSLQEGLPN